MEWLNGKKTILGSIAAGLLTVMYALDCLVNDDPLTPSVTEVAWLAKPIYLMLAAAVTSWTGVSLKLAVKKSGG